MMNFHKLSSRLRFLMSENANADFENLLPTGDYAGLLIFIRGTNNNGQTLTHADLPEFGINIGGRSAQRGTGTVYNKLMNYYFGSVESTSVANGAIGLCVFIPFFHPSMPSALHVNPGDKVSLKYQTPTNYATKVSSATVRVYGIRSDDVEKYELRFLPGNIDASGATTKVERLAQKNIKEILLNSSVVSRAVVRREGVVKTDANYADLLGATALFANVETASQADWAHISAGENPDDFVSDDTEIELDFSGSGTANIQVLSIGFDNERYQQTNSQKAAQVQKRLERVAPPDALPVLVEETRKTAV